MTRQSTARLVVAVVLVVLGASLAVMAGMPDAAFLVSPWAVLLVLGLTRTEPQRAAGTIVIDSPRVVAAESVEVTLHLVASGGWVHSRLRPDPGFWRDGVAEDDEVTSVTDVIDPTQPTELTHTVTASMWGAHDIGRVDLTIHERFGLIRWSGTLHTPTRLQVHPPQAQIQELLTPWRARRLVGAHPSRAVGRGIEFADIRPFGAGDSLRDINWPVSARTGELHVSRRYPDQGSDVVLLVDSFTESGHDVRTVLGFAIEAALTLAESHLAVNDRVGLIEFGGIVRWLHPGTGRHQLQRLTDALLATRLYDNASDRSIEIVPPTMPPPRSFVVALTPLIDERFIEGLRVVRANGHDVSVIEYPPTLRADLDRRETDDTRRVAARLWHAERQRTRDELARSGIVVGRWREGEPLDHVLAEITHRRAKARAMSGR